MNTISVGCAGFTSFIEPHAHTHICAVTPLSTHTSRCGLCKDSLQIGWQTYDLHELRAALTFTAHVSTCRLSLSHTHTQSHTHSHIKISGSTWCNKRSSTCCHARPAVFTNTVENLRLFAFISPKPSSSKGRQRPRLCLSAAEVPFSTAFNPHPLWGISHRAVDLFRIVFSRCETERTKVQSGGRLSR